MTAPLLDNVLIYATTDVGYARTHTLDEMVVFTAGRAGGKVKSGLHIDLGKKSPTAVGYTALQVMGADLPVGGCTGSKRILRSAPPKYSCDSKRRLAEINVSASESAV